MTIENRIKKSFLSFRNRLLLATTFSLFLVLLLVIPLSLKSAGGVVQRAMSERAKTLVFELTPVDSSEKMVDIIKEQKSFLFYRITLFNKKLEVLYDTHTKRILGDERFAFGPVDQKELVEALKTGVGFNEEYSELLKQPFAYYAERFNSHGEVYILRVSFPLRYLKDITDDFVLSILGVSFFTLILFCSVILVIFHRFSKPIQAIQDAISPYYQGKVQKLPLIHIEEDTGFFDLATTINLLSERIQSQIDALIEERRNKERIVESLQDGVVVFNNSALNILFATKKALEIVEVPSFMGLEKKLIQENWMQAKTLIEKAVLAKEDIVYHYESPDFSGPCYRLTAKPLEGKTTLLVITDESYLWRILQLRKEFVANVSHELRTPFTVIQGFAEALYDDGELPPHLSLMAEKIIDHCKRMTHLIEQLLLLSDIENLPLSDTQEISLVDICEAVKFSVEQAFPQAFIRLIFDENKSFYIRGNGALLERAFFNLVENALKYTENSPVEITLLHKGENIVVSIRDFGPGISSQDREKIFQRFYRSEENRRRARGSGLGLSIVRTIIEKHYGTISLDQNNKKGALFVCVFPAIIFDTY